MKAIRRALTAIGCVAVLGLAAWLGAPYVAEKLWPSQPALKVISGMAESTDPVTVALLKDMRLELRTAVLGEAREKAELIVYEQDVEASCAWDASWGELALFKKTKTVHMYGTGVYVVNLAALAESGIEVDEAAKIVTLTLPQTTLKHVVVHSERTEFEDTNNGILRFGEIKLTPEQQQLLVNTAEASMNEQCADAKILQQATLAANKAAQELFAPVVRAVDAEYVLRVK